MFDLDPTKKARTYSKGNRQKVALIAALSSDVDLLLLDEPTAGLDPLMESMFRDVIRDWRGDGRSVLLSSHILSEAEALSDRLSIIRDGRVVETGTLDQMRHLRRTSVTAVLRRAPDDARRPARRPRRRGRRHAGDLPGRRRRPSTRCWQTLSAAGVESLTTQPPTLEELFLQHYGTRVP